MAQPAISTRQETGFVRGLGLFDSTMVVIGVMIGSGIFIVSADMSRIEANNGEVSAPEFVPQPAG